jgi:fumarate reductase flavoprotein subunit
MKKNKPISDVLEEQQSRPVGRRGFLSYLGVGAAATAAMAATSVVGCADDDDLVEDADDINWDESTDIVIMGGGGAGLVAAIVALEAGAEVMVLEKADKLGGTTALSGGQVQASGTSFQQSLAMVSDDTPQRHAEYWMQASEGVADRELVELLASEAPNSIQFMVDQGLNYSGIYGVSHMPQVAPDLMVPRIHIPEADEENVLSGGARHVDVLKTAAEGLDADIRLESTVDALVTDDEDGVVGVRATVGGEERYIRARKGVIIAAGGFDHNTQMCHTYSPQQLWELETGVCYCAPTNQGDGIRLGQAAGGDLSSGMSATIGYPGATMGSTPGINGIWVNQYGQRFVAEDSHYAHAMRRVFHQQDGKAWAIFDQATAMLGGETLSGLFGRWSADLSSEISSGLILTAPTLTELADTVGIHAGQLEATVAAWNEDVVTNSADTVFERQANIAEIGEGPYYAFPVTSVNLGSCGGLRINTSAQVLDPEGEPIPGLYAAGMAAGGYIGTFYPGSGTAIMGTIVLGRISAAHAAAREVDSAATA